MEMKFEYGVICLEHAFQTGLKDVAFLEVHRPRASDDFEIESKCQSSSKDHRARRANFLQPVDDEPEMDLDQLCLNHIVMRDVETGVELKRFEVVHNPDEKFLLRPFVKFAAGRIIVLCREPSEPQIIEKCPIRIYLLQFFTSLPPSRIVERFKIGPEIKVRKIRISNLPIQLLLQHSLILLPPPTHLI
jgi:hypothetical protein